MPDSIWPLTALGKEVKFLSGGTPSKSESAYWEGHIPWIGSGEMKAERIHSTALQVTERGAVNGTKLVGPGTVLVVVRGMSLAKEFRVSRPVVPATFNQDVKALISKGKVRNDFLYYYLKAQSSAIRDSASEAAHGTKKLDMPVLEQWPLPVVEEREQRKIAAILTAYDDLIENNRQRIALLEKMAEEIYREWFVRLRFPGHEHTPVHKGVPEGWEVGRLAEMASMVFGQSPPSKHYNEIGDGLPFHQGVGSYGNRFPTHDTYCSVDGRTAEAGSILFSVRAPVGRLNITDRKVILGRGLAGLNERQGRNSYLWQLLRSTFSREDLIGNGAIFASVSKKELEGFPIFRPAEDLIDRFERLATPTDQQIDGLHRSTSLLATTRDLLLNRLISGKLRVDDLDIRFPPSMQEEAA